MNGSITIFNCRFRVWQLLAVIGAYLLTEGIFNWIFIRNSLVIEGYEKILGLLVYGFMLYRFNHLKKSERIVLGIFTLLIVRLCLESLSEYNTMFRQLTMFTVLFPPVYAFFIKYLLRSFDLDLLEFMAKFYLWVYILFMILFGRGFSFSLDAVNMVDYGPFSGDSRIIHASHILMMIIPLLWYMDQYISKRKLQSLAVAIFCLAVIVIHQHRSVWSSTFVAVFFYFLAKVRAGWKDMGLAIRIGIGAVGLAALSVFFLTNLYPGFLDFLGARFSDILNPGREGSTGNFRIAQREVYFQLFLQHPYFGWTFEGFSMANPLVDWWPADTGQHFHDGYIEMLFYHGVIGLLFKYLLLIYLLIKAFSRRLSSQAIILIAFSVSGLLFSFSYVLPLIFWGHAGMCLFYLERKNNISS